MKQDIFLHLLVSGLPFLPFPFFSELAGHPNGLELSLAGAFLRGITRQRERSFTCNDQIKAAQSR